MDSSANLLWGVLFGAVGMAFFVYGKKQQHATALISGIALCVFPYFVANTLVMVAVGAALIALPFLLGG